MLNVNFDPDFDPDFGNIQPENSDIYLVSITPKPSLEHKNATGLGWHFLLIMPKMKTDSETSELVADVLGSFLETGDRYCARPYKEEDYKNYSKSTAVISYNSERMFSEGMNYEIEDLFFWVKPPLGIMH